MTEPETNLSYEEARDALIEVVSRLESGSPTLEESLSLWERGEALADLCQSWLEDARGRLAAAAGPLEAAESGADTSAADPSAAEKEEQS
ncbi:MULTISPECIES: exodeoxyribonuclease VII small subunit [unclassified Pseudactinotalea]|uniref:exodeoxyribonuclease VII small subunit n=1 Tax=unclassified Pseudactinotalea TaxID=2649176 RepID=UPI00128D786C|nr:MULTISPECIES: exodeoxyribonuclease VII small subunit [unclassified Pseudactinotalea]MPV48733.1 exodeoxyribonuclease VII small subunit [Pseudactinotalea sp. HY160]QGH68721.1 exodeoxyribonuclease VII small subunit [Pseudactinotalea sp. HY158]